MVILKKIQQVIWILVSLNYAFAADFTADTYTNITLTKIAFGSCNKQYYEQPLWDNIVGYEPQTYLWTGDAVYVNDSDLKTLRKAYKDQLSNPGYKKLTNTGIPIHGVYDDHDMGTNDGGKEAYKRKAQNYFLNFLGGVPSDDERRKRKGLYSSHLFGEPPRQTKIIFLDTRSLRDTPTTGTFLQQMSLRYNFAAPFLLTIARWISSLFGLSKDFEGDLLGEKQWNWLDEQFKESWASVHIVVSTVQVMGSLPMVEGWGHYPKSKDRLFKLLNKYKPRGLVLLSGDVHYSEINQAKATKDGAGSVLEITQSGMTHTCLDSPFYGHECINGLEKYNYSRHAHSDYFANKSFGTLDIEWFVDEEDLQTDIMANMTISVKDEDSKPVLQVSKVVSNNMIDREVGVPIDFAKVQEGNFNEKCWGCFYIFLLITFILSLICLPLQIVLWVFFRLINIFGRSKIKRKDKALSDKKKN